MNARLARMGLLVLALIIAGCGTEVEQEPPGTAGPEELAEPAVDEPEVAAGTTALVVVGENLLTIDMMSIPPGPVVFSVQNGGEENHSLAIESAEGGEDAFRLQMPAVVSPGTSVPWDVTLDAGDYVAYCPLLDHAQNGERDEFTVSVEGEAP